MVRAGNIVPAPSIIDGKVWSIRDSGDEVTAWVDFDSMTMCVPLTKSDLARWVRAHEAGHIKRTPRDAASKRRWRAESERLGNRTLQACEDYRVNTANIADGIPPAGGWDMETVKRIATQSPLEQGRCLIAKDGTPDGTLLRSVMDPGIVAEVERIEREAFGGDPYASEESMYKAAQMLVDAFGAGKRPEPEPDPDGSEEGAGGDPDTEGEPQPGGEAEGGEATEGEAKGSGEQSGEAGEETGSGGKAENEGDAEDSEGSGEAGEPGDAESGSGGTESEQDSGAGNPEADITRPFDPFTGSGDEAATTEPGEPTLSDAERDETRQAGFDQAMVERNNEAVEFGDVRGEIPESRWEHRTPRLTTKTPAGKTRWGTKMVQDTEGEILRHVHRIAQDGAVYGRTVRRGKGSILIDVSGSMSLSNQEIEELIAAAPHATIAVHDSDGCTVIAKDGRYAANWKEIHYPGGGTKGSTYAGEWLVKQQRPHMWITDTLFQGNGGPLGPNALLKIARMVNSHKVAVIPTVAEAVKRLRKGR